MNKNNIKDFFTFFISQTITYGSVDCCTRWIAQGKTMPAVILAMFFALISFYVIKKIARTEANNKIAVIGFVMGSGLGTFLGITASKLLD